MKSSIIKLENIKVSFNNEVILGNLNLNIKEGEFVTLLGPSGCGKTTTLRIIAGFLNPDDRKCSVQSLLFGHRIKPQQTRYEYLVEFLQIAMARKRIVGDSTGSLFEDMFPVSSLLDKHKLEYMPVSNMGLKRFIFFENSRLDTKSKIVCYTKNII